MAQEIPISTRLASQRIQIVQIITIVWMTLEAGLALLAAWAARSPALLAFGGDSFVELFSAAVVLWRFTTRAKQEHAERTAARTAGVLLFVLGVFVVLGSVKTLLGHSQPSPSVLGICVLVAAIIIPPIPFPGPGHVETLSNKLGNPHLREDEEEGK